MVHHRIAGRLHSGEMLTRSTGTVPPLERPSCFSWRPLDESRHLAPEFDLFWAWWKILFQLRTRCSSWFSVKSLFNITSTVLRMWLYCWVRVRLRRRTFDNGSHASKISGVAFLSTHFFKSTYWQTFLPGFKHFWDTWYLASITYWLTI